VGLECYRMRRFGIKREINSFEYSSPAGILPFLYPTLCPVSIVFFSVFDICSPFHQSFPIFHPFMWMQFKYISLVVPHTFLICEIMYMCCKIMHRDHQRISTSHRTMRITGFIARAICVVYIQDVFPEICFLCKHKQIHRGNTYQLSFVCNKLWITNHVRWKYILKMWQANVSMKVHSTFWGLSPGSDMLQVSTMGVLCVVIHMPAL
jgi:hypothetical protein